MLPPKTSAGKYLCGELYNETEVTAPSWYIEWEKEIDKLTKRLLKISEVNSTKSVNLHRSRRSTEESLRLEAIRSATVIPKFSFKELNSRVMLNISAEAIIHNTSTQRNPFQVLVHIVDERPNSLASHNQELVRSNRINAALLLCKQRLLQWNTENLNIFERELDIKIERTAGIIANINPLQTDYSRSNYDINLWMRERLELNI